MGIKRPHPMAEVKITAGQMPCHEYMQLCAQNLFNLGFMSRTKHKSFIKQIRVWLNQNKVENEHILKETTTNQIRG